MRFIPTRISGSFIIEPEKQEDERGSFARTFCAREFEAHGLKTHYVQCSRSFNRKRGTLRGLHYQIAPHEEAKLVSCARGALYDVVVDLRPESQSLGHWIAAELTAANGRMLYVPEGCAHGFQTVEDATEIFYQISEPYDRECSRQLRWNSSCFAIAWPIADVILSEQDQHSPIPGNEFLTYHRSAVEEPR